MVRTTDELRRENKRETERESSLPMKRQRQKCSLMQSPHRRRTIDVRSREGLERVARGVTAYTTGRRQLRSR